MTEAEWLECTDPDRMLEHLNGRASSRKLRLFACACVRQVWHLLSGDQSRRAVEAAERFADLPPGPEARAVAEAAVEEFMWGPDMDLLFWVGPDAPETLFGYAAIVVADLAAPSVDGEKDNAAARDAARSVQAALLRDIIGNPFRPVRIDPAWRQWNDGCVVKLARAIYDDHNGNDLPVLADALEDAGCADLNILAHCRDQGGKHVRGCWLVDVLLGK